MVSVPIGKQDAETVGRAFVEKIVLTCGTLQILQKDQGANFVSEVFRKICKILKINKIQFTSFHPESQGSIERSHRVLAEYLRHYVSEDQTNWDSCVPFATYMYNTTETLYYGMYSIRVAVWAPLNPKLCFEEAARTPV